MINSIRTLFLTLFMLLIPSTIMAHNNVVVIPMAGDDTKLESFPPFAPVAKESPPNSDYTIGAGTVVDNITGLEWQQTDGNSSPSWDDASVYCLALVLDGKVDWQLPSVAELTSIVSYDTSSPAINSFIFPLSDSDNYWSSTGLSARGADAWYISYVNGILNSDVRSASNIVRCVRKTRANGQLLQDNGDGTVTDLATNLTWQQEDDNTLRNWDAAQSYCSNLLLANKSGWHLPNIKELISIVDFRVRNPAINGVMFPGTDLTPYWSSTHLKTSAAGRWGIDFLRGTNFAHLNSMDYHTRCVR